MGCGASASAAVSPEAGAPGACSECSAILDKVLDLDHTGEKKLAALDRDELRREVRAVLQADKASNVDLNTKFWFFLLKAMKKSHSQNYRGIEQICHPKPKRKLEYISMEGVPLLRLPLDDEDWDDRSVMERVFGGVPEQLFAMITRSLPCEDDPIWFDSVVEGLLTFQKVFGTEQLMPEPHESFDELCSDEAMSLIAFWGIGQVFLQGIDQGFEIDLSWLGGYEVRPGFEKYGCRVVFGPDKKVQSIACCHDCFVVRPGDCGWEHAKWMFKASLGIALQGRVHLPQIHWTTANLTHIACREHLHEGHPVRKVLKVFLFNTGAINSTAAKHLFPEDSWMHRASAFTHPSFVKVIRQSMEEFHYQTLPEFVKAKNLGPAQDEVPLAVDGLPVWGAFHAFFHGYVDLFYADQDALTADVELAAYWACIDQRGGASYSSRFGLPALSKEALADQLTFHAFSVTAWHEFVGSIVHYVTTPLGLPTKVRPGKEVMDVQSFLQGNLLVAMTGMRQPPILDAWCHLLPEEPLQARQLQQTLVEDLQRVSSEIDERNRTAPCQRRRRKVESFNPRHFECSVSA